MQFTRKKKKIKGRIIAAVAMAVIIAALAVTAVLLSKKAKEPETPVPAAPVEILEGEGRYLSYATAYPPVAENAMMNIEIDGGKGHYMIARPKKNSSFEFIYYDEDGKEHIYYPDILLEEEEDFEYDDLYAKVTGDGYDMIPMLTYLTNALRNPYFDDRIYLDADPAKREEQLSVYGLGGSGKKTTVKLFYGETYTDENGKTQFKTNEDGSVKLKTHVIEIGSTTITGSGYYYRVDGRDYIYVAGEYNYFRYALLGVEEFINPVLVAAGLDNNQHALYAPYLTPSYKQWVNEVHESDPFSSDEDELRDVTKIVAELKSYLPAYTRENATEIKDSYESYELGKDYMFDVTEYKDNALYPYFLEALSGKALADVGFSQSFLYENQVKKGAVCVYKIKEIEAVISENAGDRTSGAVGDARYVKVAYELFVDGKQENIIYNTVEGADGKTEVKEIFVPYHGILDLEALRAAGVDPAFIRTLSVGELTEPLEVTVTYEGEDSVGELFRPITAEYFVDEVLEIYEYAYNSEGEVTGMKQTYKITDKSVVVYRFYRVYGGVAETAQIGTIDMKAASDEENSEQKEKIRSVIRQMHSSGRTDAVRAYSEEFYNSVMSDFITYDFSNVRAYVSSELIIGFGFVNASERDPFYGESFYEKSDDVSMLYAVNQSSCEAVVRLLGGIAETSKAEGLAGIKTVKVGVTHDALLEYGCYANSLLFKLPRDMYVSNETADDELDDMSWLSTLDFMLYISEPEYDLESGGWYRYVASEIYDVIVMIDADVLGFVDLDPVEFWARRSLILVDVEDIHELNIEFNMSDLKGKYSFEAEHTTVWINTSTGEKHFGAKPTDGSWTAYDLIDVYTTQTGETTVDTEFEKYLKEEGLWKNGSGSGYISDLYDYLAGTAVFEGRDFLGTAVFKNLALLLYFTQYTGTLTDEEQASVLDPDGDGSSDDALEPIMSFSVKLRDKDPDKAPEADTEKEYHYEFYRLDDRRIMVRLFETKNGTVVNGAYASDFYVSILAYRKIVTGFISLLNGKTVDVEDPYPDYMI